MGWFSEQLLLRKQSDEKQISEAYEELNAVTRKKRKKVNSKNYDMLIIGRILTYFKREMPQVVQKGIVDSQEELAQYFRKYNIIVREAEISKGFRKYAIGPMLATRVQDGKKVVLEPGRISGYRYYDQQSEKFISINSNREADFNDKVLCFYEALPDKPISIGTLLKFLCRQISVADYIKYVLLLLIVTVLGAFSTIITKKLMGDITAIGRDSVLALFAIFVLCFIVSKNFFSLYNNLFLQRIYTKQENAVSAAVLYRVMSFPASFFKRYSTGELSNRIQNVQNLCQMLFRTLGVTVLTFVFSFIFIFQIGIITPSLLTPAIVITILSFAFGVISTLVQTGVSRKQIKMASATRGMTYAIITGIQKIKLAGAEGRFFARWASKYATEASLSYNPPMILKLNSAISTAISLFGAIAIYYASIKNHVSQAEYFAFYAAFGMVSAAVSQLLNAISTIASIKPVLETAAPILKEQPEICIGKKIVNKLEGRIEINNLYFRYEKDKPYVINNLSLCIEPGEYVAIVGSTGCGKSTLLRLLLGFEKPENGTIYYDKDEIGSLDPCSLRKNIGTVLQNEKLLPGTIFSNISFTAPNMTKEDAWQVAISAQIAEDIAAMPMKMDTVITEGQGGISGGQRQRLVIARALAGKPNIMILDEATSALDNDTQSKVMKVIDSLECTKIVIAHRLSLVKNCSRIIALDGGKIVEEGTYDELMAKDGFFANLVRYQQLDCD